MFTGQGGTSYLGENRGKGGIYVAQNDDSNGLHLDNFNVSTLGSGSPPIVDTFTDTSLTLLTDHDPNWIRSDTSASTSNGIIRNNRAGVFDTGGSNDGGAIAEMYWNVFPQEDDYSVIADMVKISSGNSKAGLLALINSSPNTFRYVRFRYFPPQWVLSSHERIVSPLSYNSITLDTASAPSVGSLPSNSVLEIRITRLS